MVKLWNGNMPLEQDFGQEPALTIFKQTTNQGKRGMVIVLPGGGYEELCDSYEGTPVAQWFADNGINGASLAYRIKPYRYPCGLFDVQRAVQYVRHNCDELGVLPDKIAVLGFSAGGHLSAMAGTMHNKKTYGELDELSKVSPRPDAMVLCYAPIAVSRLHKIPVNLIGQVDDQALFDEVSPDLHVDESTSPAFIWTTGEDELVNARNSIAMAMELYNKKIPCELHVYEKGPHGLDMAVDNPHINTWTTLCLRWLKAQGF